MEVCFGSLFERGRSYFSKNNMGHRLAIPSEIFLPRATNKITIFLQNRTVGSCRTCFDTVRLSSGGGNYLQTESY